MNLLFSMDHNYIPVFQNCFKSILMNGGQSSYSVYILHSDLTGQDQQNIRLLDPHSDFHFLWVDPKLFDGFPTTSRYPAQIYYRLAAPMLIGPEIERILYLDGDTIIINPLDSLYSQDFEDSYIIACSHTGILLNSVNQVRLGMEKSVPYINSGVMLMNLKALRENLSLRDIQEYAWKKDLVLFLPDQDILTALYGDKIKLADARKFNLTEKLMRQNNLDPTKEVITSRWVGENTSIIHYLGRNKPWKENYSGFLQGFYKQVILHKNLIFLAGKESRALAGKLNEQLLHSVWLDGNTFWQASPMVMNEQVEEMTLDNIAYTLGSYLSQPICWNIIFTWDFSEPRLHGLLESLSNPYAALYLVGLQEADNPEFHHTFEWWSHLMSHYLEETHHFDKMITCWVEKDKQSPDQIADLIRTHTKEESQN